ncbi:MAG: hypothetical protein Kow00104_15500 [Rhodothalassiaceae bacterium]
MRWPLRLGALISLLLLAGCGGPSGSPEPYPLVEGLRARISMNAGWYDLEVTEVDGARATLIWMFQGQPLSERTQYRGLYPVSGTDDGRAFVNDIDIAEIDSLFPLAIGKEAAFEGRSYYLPDGTDSRLFVHMEVTGTDRIALADAGYDVFLIRISTAVERDGARREFVRTLYYAPEIGLPLKMVMKDGEASSWWRVTSIETPGRSRRNRLGTVMI